MSEAKIEVDRWTAHLEHIKHQIDYIKHMTTLSTGSILLLSTFLEKLFSSPHWKALVVTTFIGFIVSVMGSVMAHTIYIMDNEFFMVEEPQFSAKTSVLGAAILAIWVGFLLGVISLAIFAIRNFI